MDESVDSAAEAPHVPDPATEPGFDLLGGEAKQPADTGYRVLARKYRPTTFEDLVGQEAMVRTLKNAFESGRIAHAFMLTGVRGVGKTTTARILARALNYSKAPGDQPTIELHDFGEHCEAIMESRHQDVLEMDAASRTGIDDIREIIESVRYNPVSARYKVYIIDEVHMLSKQAFNGLLKTLEEPPAHVKFIFATTEIRKVPVTVLSRCQRFDLRRLSSEELMGLLKKVSDKEGVTAEDPALGLLARAAEGSARDGLSLLDQAIAHGAGHVKEEDARDMLGLADRARIFDLFDFVMKGEIGNALAELRDQYDAGADPEVILSDLAELTHWLTRLKLAESAADDMTVTETERVRGQEMAKALPVRVLSRVWQMLLKGIQEVQGATKPIAAAEMVLVRLAYVSDQPSPEELVARLKDHPVGGAASPASGGGASGGGAGGTRMSRVAGGGVEMSSAASQPVATARATPEFRTFQDVIAHAKAERDIRLVHTMETGLRLVHFEKGRIEINVVHGDNSVAGQLAERLKTWTGERWLVSISKAEGAPTVHDQKQTRHKELRSEIVSDPLVKAVLEMFPGATIKNIVEPELLGPAPTDGMSTEDED
ncbi:MAG: DNA polymerase III subunit gamma/tau [Alphaproteobacteria bacterium]|nr:DNA polymerase III subunit gamma/tau [Alphaproteobacteria bacterium]MBO6627582.1 DNA polymerase III subunit gamma/tau [Alphaproteobacteria bacterium]MDF1627800.1 DNA polymerase III subunit gamma/tau [Parvibaculaceae bacterium]